MVDEDVPEAAATFLEERGGRIERAVRTFGQRTVDPVLAQYADDEHGVMVTCNQRDFDRLFHKGHRFPNASGLYLPQQIKAVPGLPLFWDVIEHLLSRRRRHGEQFTVEVNPVYLKIRRRGRVQTSPRPA